jgi:hypothetical protein
MTSPVFKKDMTVTVRRGKRKGETATVESVTGDQVVVKHMDGSISLQNAPSLKAPEVPTIDADTLADVFRKASADTQRDGEELYVFAREFIDPLLSGFSDRLLKD